MEVEERSDIMESMRTEIKGVVILPEKLREPDVRMLITAVDTQIRLISSYINRTREQEYQILKYEFIKSTLEDALLAM